MLESIKTIKLAFTTTRALVVFVQSDIPPLLRQIRTASGKAANMALGGDTRPWNANHQQVERAIGHLEQAYSLIDPRAAATWKKIVFNQIAAYEDVYKLALTIADLHMYLATYPAAWPDDQTYRKYISHNWDEANRYGKIAENDFGEYKRRAIEDAESRYLNSVIDQEVYWTDTRSEVKNKTNEAEKDLNKVLDPIKNRHLS